MGERPMEDRTKEIVLIINDSPYGNERPHDCLRLALSLAVRPGVQVRVFMIGDGVFCARRGQARPNGRYNIERMLVDLAQLGQVAV